MNRQETLDCLDREGIGYELTEHKAVYNMAELVVRDDKRLNYYLITVRGEKRVNLKDFRRQHGTRPLTFASEEELLELLGLTPGAVTPLGLLHDTACRVRFYLDQDCLEEPGIIGIHPNDNTATVWLKTRELAELIRRHGTPTEIVPF